MCRFEINYFKHLFISFRMIHLSECYLPLAVQTYTRPYLATDLGQRTHADLPGTYVVSELTRTYVRT